MTVKFFDLGDVTAIDVRLSLRTLLYRRATRAEAARPEDDLVGLLTLSAASTRSRERRLAVCFLRMIRCGLGGS